MSRTPRTRNMRQPQPMQERLITDYPFGRFWDVKGQARVQSDCVACLGQQLVVATLFPDLTLGTCSLLSPAALTRNNSYFTRNLSHCRSNSSSSKPQSRFGCGCSMTRRRRRRQSDCRKQKKPSKIIKIYHSRLIGLATLLVRLVHLVFIRSRALLNGCLDPHHLPLLSF